MLCQEPLCNLRSLPEGQKVLHPHLLLNCVGKDVRGQIQALYQCAYLHTG